MEKRQWEAKAHWQLLVRMLVADLTLNSDLDITHSCSVEKKNERWKVHIFTIYKDIPRSECICMS